MHILLNDKIRIMSDKKLNHKKIKEINKHISDGLRQWSAVVIHADADEWAYYLDYSDEDLLNAMFIFNHVWQNRAIKSEHFKDEEDVIAKMSIYKNAVKIAFGIDTIELTEKVLGKEAEDETTTEKNSTEA